MISADSEFADLTSPGDTRGQNNNMDRASEPEETRKYINKDETCLDERDTEGCNVWNEEQEKCISSSRISDSM